MHAQRQSASWSWGSGGAICGLSGPCRWVGGPGPPSTPRSGSRPPPAAGLESRAVQQPRVPTILQHLGEGWPAGGLKTDVPEPCCFCNKAYGAPTGASWVEEGVVIQGAPSLEVSFSGWGDGSLTSGGCTPAAGGSWAWGLQGGRGGGAGAGSPACRPESSASGPQTLLLWFPGLVTICSLEGEAQGS